MNGPLCECGNNGCLEAYASEVAILNKAKEELKNHQDTILTEWLKDNSTELSLNMVYKVAKKGDPFAISLLEKAGQSLD